MTTLQMLTLRRNAALSRLAALEKRAQRPGAPGGNVIATALKELGTALEEIHVATEQIQLNADELAVARHELHQVRQSFTDFIDMVPMACVWTTASGDIDLANSAAAELLNVSAARLVGRPLMLFLTERQAFADALRALTEGLTSVIEVPAVVRPRERRPRSLRLLGRNLPNDTRHCWFLMAAGSPESPGEAAGDRTHDQSGR